jgi:hypothetical protein
VESGRDRTSHCWPGRAALGLATLALLWSSSSRAQSLTDTPDAGLATDAGHAPALAPVPAPPPPVAPPDEAVAAQVGVRSLVRAQNPNAPSKVNDVGAAGEADVVLWGQVHPLLKWQAGFIGALGGQTETSAALLDLVAKLEFADAFNLWLGRMPIPSDRTSLSTAWAIAPWTLPGEYGNYAPIPPAGARPPPGPRQGEFGRGDGGTLWGQVRGGRLKYYAGVFGLGQPDQSPLLSARLTLNLLDPEPGFRSSSSYFGNKDVFALGFGAQHQSHGSLPPATSLASPADFNEVNTDILLELGGPTTGVLDVESAFDKMWGKNEIASYQFFALASYLVPLDIGIGRFQPLVRLELARHGSAEDASDMVGIDAQLGYIIDGHRARVVTGYQYVRIHSQAQNAILLGVQLLTRAP